MFKRNALTNFLGLEPLFETVVGDAGGGAGGGAASSSDAAAGAAAGSQTGADALPQGARVVGDNDYVLVDGKHVKWSDARQSHYMPRSQWDRGVEFLTTVAKRFDQMTPQQQAAARQANGNAGQQRQMQAPPQQQQDPFANLENMAVVDGRTLAKLGRQMQQEGFGPMGQVISSMATRMQQLEQRLGGVGQTVQGLNQNHADGEFENYLTTSLKSIPEVKGFGMIDTNNPAIRELAKDLYLSYNQNDPSLQKMFPQMLQERVTQLFQTFTQMQRTYVEAQKQNRRQFFNPQRGAAAPTGPQAYKHETGEQLARRFFAADSNT